MINRYSWISSCPLIAFVAGGLFVVAATSPARTFADERLQLSVLYLKTEGDRAKDFTEFFRKHFVKVEAANRDAFDVNRASVFDVVVLDWSQRDTSSRDAVSPLGDRATWGKPTVLLGSAGHLLASPWSVIGGSG
jgi:hypothetical protein